MFFFSAFAAILFLFGSSQKTSLGVNALAIPNPRYSLSTEATIGSGNIMERQLNNNDQEGDIAAIVRRAGPPVPASIRIVPASTRIQSSQNQPGRKPNRRPGELDGTEGTGEEGTGEEGSGEEGGSGESDGANPNGSPDPPDKCDQKNLTKKEKIKCKKQKSPPSA